jgi:hypothetical protein
MSRVELCLLLFRRIYGNAIEDISNYSSNMLRKSSLAVLASKGIKNPGPNHPRQVSEKVAPGF